MFDSEALLCDIGRADLVVPSTRPALTETTMERRMAALTQARVRELFNYNAKTGLLVWRERPLSHFKSEATYHSFCSRFQGKDAGHVERQGYRVIVCDGKARKAHHLVWLWVTGELPEYPAFEIDHINGNRADNRIENLRKVTKTENQRNTVKRVTNTSGVHGVNWVESKQRWVARIWNGPRHVYLGCFENLADAAIARRAAERVLGHTVRPAHTQERQQTP
jgi:hypothetical protein